MHLLNLAEGSKTFNLSAKLYDVYITGGHSVSMAKNVEFIVEKSDNGKKIIVLKKKWKGRTRENGKKAVRYYSFKITEQGEYKIRIENPDGIKVTDSIMDSHPIPIHKLFLKSVHASPEEIDFVISTGYK